MEFKIYQCLADLSKKLYAASNDLSENYSVCWQNSSYLTEAIVSDIQSITNEACFVTNVSYYLEDTTYRQGASGCILEIKFNQGDEFTITAECLIDYGKVMLRVKQSSSDSKYNAISEMIEAKYSSEYKTELRELEKLLPTRLSAASKE
ncbi:hypothetical protein [Pontibacter chinhatensis]|uniref:Uncharacterized protein n=1 Tax=Pontibacter chinhatensis TaxID=1436961 RepID=A0A1I2X3G1_9BACT|nr:hypothetical protein [Pontibacter chinhatensis]SFH07226.1 hypothetical protein SAMN05421739_105323 [Pontibacter chinhatensis]